MNDNRRFRKYAPAAKQKPVYCFRITALHAKTCERIVTFQRSTDADRCCELLLELGLEPTKVELIG